MTRSGVAKRKGSPKRKREKGDERGSRGRGRRGPAARNLAERADPLGLYVRAVQAPEVDAEFLEAVYGGLFGRKPRRLREDFCGSAALCAAWVARGPKREAWGVDLHAPTLAWGQRAHLEPLAPRVARRVTLLEGDVRTTDTPPVDVLCAQNFSYFTFKERETLKAYFRSSKDALGARGVFVVDVFGGYESIEDERADVTDHGDFHYVWEQHRFDPINGYGIYKIHFRFPDGSAIEDAFVYDWRMWTLPEVQDLMTEVGFDEVVVYWEEEDPDTGEGTGVFSPRASANCDPAWNAYVVGVKRG